MGADYFQSVLVLNLNPKYLPRPEPFNINDLPTHTRVTNRAKIYG